MPNVWRRPTFLDVGTDKYKLLQPIHKFRFKNSVIVSAAKGLADIELGREWGGVEGG